MTIKHRAGRPAKLIQLASRLLSVLLLSAAPLALADDVGSDQTRIEFNIPVQTVPTALSEFARQARVQLFFISDGYEDVRANALFGTYTPQQALDLLLDGTGLKASISPYSGIEVKPVSRTMSLRSDKSPLSAAVREVAVADGAGGSRDPGGLQAEREREKRAVEEIVVTGTNIRGVAPESSPVRTFTREDIQISGAGTAQDFIQTLTANFGGGSNSDIAAGLPNDSASGGNNVTFGALGSSVNLRGLGSGGTLVLLNGHRVAPSSGVGDFTDISMIPASAIERVDVLQDGGSSIYGSDAVAGVVNFLLRKDYEGVETLLRYGLGTQARSPEEFRASITGGTNWESGNALVVYEYFNQDQISAADRPFSKDTPLPNDLQPSQERHSVVASLFQNLAANLEAFADFTYSTRDARHRFTIRDPSFSTPSWETLSISAGTSWKVSDSWFVDVSGTYSSTHGRTAIIDITPDAGSPTINDTDSKLWTGDVKASGTLITLPGGDLKLAIGGQFRKEKFVHTDVDTGTIERQADRKVYALFGEALIPFIEPEHDVPGIKRFEVNVSGRLDDHSDFGSTVNPKVGVLWAPVEPLKLRGSYSTSFNPPPLGRVGAFDSTVSVFSTLWINDLFGFEPADPSIADVIELQVSGTGKDLKAENSRTFTMGMDFHEDWQRHAIAFSINYFDIEFEKRLGRTPVPQNQSAFDGPNIAFNNPNAFPEGTIIFSPSQGAINSIIDDADRLFFFGGATEDDITNAQIINHINVTRNLSRTETSGFDFNTSYTYESYIGDLSFGLDVTYLDEFKQQAATSTRPIEHVDTLFNPIDLRLRTHAGYTNDGFTANIFVNYTDDYRVDNTDDAIAISSWTTADLSLAYDTEQILGNPVLNDTVLRLSVLNIFDEAPPSTPTFPISLLFGFDPANASPLQRFIAFELTKRF